MPNEPGPESEPSPSPEPVDPGSGSEPTSAAPSPDLARAEPTKAFFVSMLTRDISLADAILDLVDNSLDGALRSGAPATGYQDFRVELTVSGEQFVIIDNCGGIPRDVAIEYAFKMGRDPADARDTAIETIGMYGIGMKRATFKIGTEISVQTKHGEDEYEVKIDAAWLTEPGWKPLPLLAVDPADALQSPGTRISVRALHAGVSAHFRADHFVDELRKALGDHFTLFLQRGFSIVLNERSVEPTKIEILADPGGPRPYYFEMEKNETQIRVAAGINPGIPLEDGDEDEDDSRFQDNRAVATAGWTIFCNDRAVLVGDKSRLTGWGDGVPLFHPQFSVITGIVEFRARDAKELPITTTKRALDTSSESWLIAKSIMRDALAVFVRHTNRWKNVARSQQSPHWQRARPHDLADVAHMMEEQKLTANRKFDGARYFDPTAVLPKPPAAQATNSRITFSRPKEQIRVVAQHLLDDANEKPSRVGEACFSRVLKEIERE